MDYAQLEDQFLDYVFVSPTSRSKPKLVNGSYLESSMSTDILVGSWQYHQTHIYIPEIKEYFLGYMKLVPSFEQLLGLQNGYTFYIQSVPQEGRKYLVLWKWKDLVRFVVVTLDKTMVDQKIAIMKKAGKKVIACFTFEISEKEAEEGMKLINQMKGGERDPNPVGTFKPKQERPEMHILM